MSIYHLSGLGIIPIERTTFQSSGIRERQDLQSKLRDKIEIISPNTLIISEEFSDWEDSKRRIDLLGIDKDANLVVIELKRDETGTHMELQSLRYAAMISTMSFEKCVSVYQKYLTDRGFDKNAQTELMSFLEWENPVEYEFAPKVKIVLASTDFSKELTTCVMYLISMEHDITCVKLTPYTFEGKLILDIDQIIPLPETKDYVVKIREKETERENLSSYRDKTKYFFDGKRLKKGRLVLEVVKRFTNDHPSFTYEQLLDKFPSSLQGSYGVIDTLESVLIRRTNSPKYRRFYMEDDDILTSADDIQFVVCTQWGSFNIDKIVEFCKSEGYPIERTI